MTGSNILQIKLSIPCLLFIILSLFSFNCKKSISHAERIKAATILLNEWKLRDAEALLSPIAGSYNKNKDFVECYSKLLLYRGKLNKLKTFFSTVPDSIVLNNNSLLFRKVQLNYFSGELDSAEILANELLDSGISAGDTVVISRAYNQLGRINFNRGNYKDALNKQVKSLKFARSIHSSKETADALRQIGVIYWYHGKLDSAKNYFYLPALSIYKKINDKIGEATTISNIGLLNYNLQDWQEEIYYQLKAFFIRKRIGDNIGIADSYYFFSHIPPLDKYIENKSNEFLKMSYDLSKAIGYKWGQDVAKGMLETNIKKYLPLKNDFSLDTDSSFNYFGELKLLRKNFMLEKYRQEKNYKKLAELYKHFYDTAVSFNYEIFKFFSLVGYGASLIELDSLNRAEKIIKKSKKLTYEKNARKYPYRAADFLLAKIHYKKREYKKALKSLATLAEEYDSLYLSKLNNSNFLTGLQTAVESVSESRSAVYQLLIDLCWDIQDYKHLFYYSEKEKLFPAWSSSHNHTSADNLSINHFIDVLLAYNKNPGLYNSGDIIKVFDKIRHRNEDIKNIKLKLSTATSLPVKLSILQQSLQADHYLLDFTFGDRYPYIILLGKNHFKIVKLKISNEELSAIIYFYRDIILRGEKKPAEKTWFSPSKFLFDNLLKPVFDKFSFPENSYIIISPAGFLQLLPFNTLIFNDNYGSKKFLCEKYIISYTPSASSFNNNKSDIKSIMALVPEATDLRYSFSEIEKIPGSLFTKKIILQGNEATSASLLSSLEDYSVIHFAGHTNINFYSPLFSSMKLNDGKLFLYQIFNSKIKTQLIILSSCSSGFSEGFTEKISTEQNLVSFSKAWLTAGANSVIASNWIVEDKTTSELMKYFYTYLQKDKNKSPSGDKFARALNLAQRQLISELKQKGENAHPFLWGAFYLAGK